jgi:peptidoglycan/LPS O-acetylase OafA/YrhL
LGSSVVAVPVVAEIFGSQLPAQFLFTLIATFISLAMAAVSYHFYEARFLKLKRWFPYRKRELLEVREQYTSL